ncbi:MAG TPA: cellulase family glycosylhydrolase [Chloroflexota bacterium]|nr:cellulase family glycosylhydrolase [Chloroflexota bacterium]
MGSSVVDEAGHVLRLRGVGLGGWLNMENFITGFPGNEEGWRDALRRELGEDRYTFLFERFLEYFFADEDAAYVRSLGLNLVRIPINYRHFESDADPLVVRDEGFRHLDRAIEVCARHELYTVIDLHAVQGYQNPDWHCDNPTHRALLWQHRHFQDRAAHLWEVIADRYRGNRWVAGYNLINEPEDRTHGALIPVTRRLYDAVRAVDPDHLVFVDGNHFASDFSDFTEAWPGVVYSAHDYALCGFPGGGPYPGYTGSVWCDRAWLERHYLRKSAFMREHGAPVWIGEFGPVYSGDRELDATRYDLAADQIALYDRYGAHWALWTYKDIGLQGLVYAAPDSPYVRRIAGVLTKKSRFGVDSWGGTDAELSGILEAVTTVLTGELSPGDELPWDPIWQSRRLLRSILFAEALVPEAAACFRDLDEAAIDTLMRSFAFENCMRRESLASLLAAASEKLIPTGA